MWVGYEYVHVPAWYGASIALFGALIALGSFFIREPAPRRSDDDRARADVRNRLQLMAQSAMDIAASTKTEEAFERQYRAKWDGERIALYGFLETQWGMAIRHGWLTRVPKRSEVDELVAALREVSEWLDRPSV